MSDYAKYVESEECTVQPVAGFRKGYVYGLVLNITLGGFFFGYVMSAFNPISDFVKDYAYGGKVNPWLITFMTAFVPLGAGIGALSAGGIAKAVGRKVASLAIDAAAIVGTILTLLPSEYSLLIGRLIQGFCVGANSSLVPLSINEVAPSEAAGTLGTFNQLQICFGVIAAPLIALGMPTKDLDKHTDSQYFRIILGVAAIPAILRALLTLAVFRLDTPKYLVSKDRDIEAHDALTAIYGTQRAQIELVSLKRQRDLDNQGTKLTIGALFGPKYSRRLLVGVGAALFQQLSGINAIIFFSNKIFAAGDPTDQSLPTIYTIIMDALQIVGCLIAGLIIERLGRRILLIGGILALAAFLGGFGIVSLIDPKSPLLKFLIWGYIIAFGLSMGPVPWIYISDVLPDVAVGIAVLANWLTTFIIGLSFEAIVGWTGMAFPFLIFAALSVAGAGFFVLFAKETKGKSPQEIENLFAGNNTKAKDEGLYGSTNA